METLNKLRLYIAGPMRGYPRNNHEAFDRAYSKWTRNPAVGDIINPSAHDDAHGIDPEKTLTKMQLKDCMIRDLDLLFGCDTIYMLKGWERSDGAKVEHALALYLGLLVMYES